MGEPALKLLPAEELAAEEAAKQSTRLLLIEGGEGAAAGTGEMIAGETVGEGLLAGAGAIALAVGAFFLVLLWPSEIAPDPKPRMGPPPKPAPVPIPNPQPLTQPCPQEEEKKKKCEKLTSELEELKKTIPKRHPMDTGNEKKMPRIPCSYIRQRLEHMRKLLNKRWEIQHECFGGRPDPGHKEAIENAENSIRFYEELERINCAHGHPMEGL